VVEVTSHATAAYDRGVKVDWYRTYGVRECWLIDQRDRAVVIVDFSAGANSERRFAGAERIVSSVVPRLAANADEFF